jgi:hypothetical protein
VADGLVNVHDKAKRLKLATELFGTRNSRMLSFLNQGSAGMHKFLEEGKQYDFIIGDKAIAASMAFHEAIEKVKFVVYGLRNVMGVELMPHIQEAIEAFLEWVKVNRDLIKQNIVGFVKGIVAGFKALWGILKPILQAIVLLVKALGGAEKATKLFLAVWASYHLVGIATSLWGILSTLMKLPIVMQLAGYAWSAFNLLFVDTPIGFVIAGIILLVQDFMYFMEGKKSVFGVIVNAIRYIGDALEEALGPWKKYLDILNIILTGGGSWIMPQLAKAIPNMLATTDAHVLGGHGNGMPGTGHFINRSEITVNVHGGQTNSETGTVVAGAVEEKLNQIHRQAGRAHKKVKER